MADEPNELERLVAQRIREQLGEGGLQRLIEAWRQIEAQVEGGRLEAQVRPVEAQFGDSVGITDSADVVISPDPAVLVLRGASPELAIDIEGRSPRDIKLAVDLYMAFLATLTALLALWSTFHQQPPNPTQIIEIFNQTTNFVHQTIINMPPPVA